MGTQYYDSIGQASNDYSMPDLLQMVGRAGRPGVDSKAVYVCLMMSEKLRFPHRVNFFFHTYSLFHFFQVYSHVSYSQERVLQKILV